MRAQSPPLVACVDSYLYSVKQKNTFGSFEYVPRFDLFVIKYQKSNVYISYIFKAHIFNNV